MNNYEVASNSRMTYSSMVTASILASGFMAVPPISANQAPVGAKIERYSYPNNESYSSAFDSLLSGRRIYEVQGNALGDDGIFEKVVSGFYGKLLAKQEPLGNVASKVLHDNLWDLYAR